MEFLLKTSGVIVLFYAVYKIFLQNETFFQQNRVFFLSGYAAALLLPLLKITHYVETGPEQPLLFSAPVSAQASEMQSQLSPEQIAWMIYFAGIAFFALRYIFHLLSLFLFIKKSGKTLSGDHILIHTEKDFSPFSFFNYIVLNPSQFDKHEQLSILRHEKTHVSHLHSIDNIISQLFTIFFWFNPFAWLYRNELQKNLEYIADSVALQHPASEKKAYQYLLLKTAAPVYNIATTSNFYNSLIKKRISMIHKEHTPRSQQLKLLIIVPALLAFVFLFNTQTVAQTKKSNYVVEIGTTDITIIIDKNTTNAQLKVEKEELKKKGIEFKYSKIRRNNKGEITGISFYLKNKKGNKVSSFQNSDLPINPILVQLNLETGTMGVRNLKTAESGVIIEKVIEEETDSNTQVYHIKSDTKNSPTVYVYKSNGHSKTNNGNGGIQEEEMTVKIFDFSDDASENGKQFIYTTTNSNGQKPLFYVNGKEVSEQELNKIDPDTIKFVNVLKGKKAIEKYGDKGKNGVVSITLKE